MLGIGDKFPSFNVKATAALPFNDMTIDNVFIDVNEKSYPGKWLVVFFYPKDFTFVCPTEIAAFGELNEDFSDRDTQLLGGITSNIRSVTMTNEMIPSGSTIKVAREQHLRFYQNT